MNTCLLSGFKMKLVLFITFLNQGSSRSVLFNQEENNFAFGISMGKCISTVGTQFYDLRKDIVLVDYDSKRATQIPTYGIDFKRNKNWTFYSADIEFLPEIFQCYDKNYFLEIATHEDAAQAFQIMKNLNCWNPNQRFFIVLSGIFAEHSSELIKMVALTQKQMLDNIVVMIIKEESKQTFDIYYWSAREIENCYNGSKLPHFFRCRFGVLTFFGEHHEVPTACSLKVKAISWPPFVLYKGKHKPEPIPTENKNIGGFEIELMDLVSKLADIEVKYLVSTREDWGRSFFNGSTTASMEDLSTRKVDIAIGSLTVSLSRSLLFATSIPYAEEHLVCCVPFLQNFDIFPAFFNRSSLYVYFSIYLVYLLLTSLIWLAAQFNIEEFGIYKKGPSVFLYSLAAIIGNSVSELPKTKMVRLFFLMLIIFELFYMAFYQSFLTSVLSKPKFNQEIKVLSDIIKRNMNVYNQPENHRYFEFHQNGLSAKVSKLWINCKNTTECLKKVVTNKKEAICLGEKYKDYVTQNSGREGKPLLHCINQKVISYPVVMVMRKSLPLKKKIDKIIGNVLAAGLVNKWTSALFYNKTKVSFNIPVALSGILRFDHLKPVFLLVNVGLGIACLVFITEKLYFLSHQ